jgi:hypothetical protein
MYLHETMDDVSQDLSAELALTDVRSDSEKGVSAHVLRKMGCDAYSPFERMVYLCNCLSTFISYARAEAP